LSGSRDPDDREPRVVIESEAPGPEPLGAGRDPITERLRIRLRESIERNQRAAESDAVKAGAWDAIARALDRVKFPRPIVLIVEDDDPTRLGYIRGLENECEIIACRKVEEAKEAIEVASRLDLVILDLGLPDGHGYDVAAYLRRTDRFVHDPDVIVISAYVTDAIKTLFSRLPGNFSWIEKVSTERISQIKRAIRMTPVKGTPTTK
jgi:CheY-like chemotaxis protein